MLVAHGCMQYLFALALPLLLQYMGLAMHQSSSGGLATNSLHASTNAHSRGVRPPCGKSNRKAIELPITVFVARLPVHGSLNAYMPSVQIDHHRRLPLARKLERSEDLRSLGLTLQSYRRA